MLLSTLNDRLIDLEHILWTGRITEFFLQSIGDFEKENGKNKGRNSAIKAGTIDNGINGMEFGVKHNQLKRRFGYQQDLSRRNKVRIEGVEETTEMTPSAWR